MLTFIRQSNGAYLAETKLGTYGVVKMGSRFQLVVDGDLMGKPRTLADCKASAQGFHDNRVSRQERAEALAAAELDRAAAEAKAERQAWEAEQKAARLADMAALRAEAEKDAAQLERVKAEAATFDARQAAAYEAAALEREERDFQELMVGVSRVPAPRSVPAPAPVAVFEEGDRVVLVAFEDCPEETGTVDSVDEESRTAVVTLDGRPSAEDDLVREVPWSQMRHESKDGPPEAPPAPSSGTYPVRRCSRCTWVWESSRPTCPNCGGEPVYDPRQDWGTPENIQAGEAEEDAAAAREEWLAPERTADRLQMEEWQEALIQRATVSKMPPLPSDAPAQVRYACRYCSERFNASSASVMPICPTCRHNRGVTEAGPALSQEKAPAPLRKAKLPAPIPAPPSLLPEGVSPSACECGPHFEEDGDGHCRLCGGSAPVPDRKAKKAKLPVPAPVPSPAVRSEECVACGHRQEEATGEGTWACHNCDADNARRPSPSPVKGGLAALAARIKSGEPAPSARSSAVGHPHLIIQARAGTGKTTTLIEGMKIMAGMASSLVPSDQQAAVWEAMALSRVRPGQAAFVAFNSGIAEELKHRVPRGYDAMTMHSLGYRAVRNSFNIKEGKEGVNKWRTRNLICELLGTDSRSLQKARPGLLEGTEQIVKLCKVSLLCGSPEDVLALIQNYDMEVEEEDAQDIIDLVPYVLERAKDVAKDRYVDFDDQIWLPLVLNLPVRRYDVLLVDEYQDLNRAQQELAKKAGRRLIFCGDDRQAIYRFTGADEDGMATLLRELEATPEGCRVLPLTVTRRCGKRIVAEAQKLVPDFEAFETNPEGELASARYPGKKKTSNYWSPVTEVRWEDSYGPQVQVRDMVLCRCNAPLISQCFRFLRAGVPAVVRGRDIGAGLYAAVEKAQEEGASTVPLLVAWIESWRKAEEAKENAKENPSDTRLIAIADKAECLSWFCSDAANVAAVLQKIDAVFSDATDSGAVLLSSIHKAKGLEAKNVFLLEPEGATVPHPMAKSEADYRQELNLRYVAQTRAIEKLTYVS